MHNTTHTLLIPTSVGDLLDKLTILEIKEQRITDAVKLQNVHKEQSALLAIVEQSLKLDSIVRETMEALRQVNLRLWEVEDALRECEARQQFDERFVSLARSVYINNDERATLKKKINELTGSQLIEEKSYARYRPEAS